jgi:hypothetical protein
MEKKIVASLLILAAFSLAHEGGSYLNDNLYPLLQPWLPAAAWRFLLRGALYVALPLLVLALLHGSRNAIAEAGLATRAGAGICIGLLGALPMLLGAGLLAGFQFTFDAGSIFYGCFMAAVGEEILYRGFLFGQLYRHAGWGFVAAGLANALIFGAGHLYQGHDLASWLGVYAVTFMGGLWFSWLYVEYGYNLWVPLSYHFFMNLSWSIFDVSDGALGSLAPNLFRAATIALSIVMVVRYKRRTAQPWIIRFRRPQLASEV